MDALIYTLMNGASEALDSLQIHANNLANAQTDGFRADLAYAREQPVAGYGYDARHHVRLQADAVSARAGAVVETGRPLDVAIEGDAYLAVSDTQGNEAYTRAGALQIDADGALTVNGRPVLGDSGPIVLPDYDAVEIGTDGTISIRGAGDTALQPVDRLALVRADAAQLTKDEAGLLVSRDGAPLAADDTVRVTSGHLERSDVSPVEEMLGTMQSSREFEIEMRMYKSADKLADAGNRLIRGA